MPRQARGEILDPAEIQIVHCVQRCVRRAFLCGSDPLSGKSFEHRRQWMRNRLEFLASIFAIDCLTYTLMSNHIHLVLRSRPDVVAAWSDKEVAQRWLRLFPRRREPDGSPAEPNEAEIASLVNQPAVLAERRRRLSDISWWMKCSAENIARRANAEDECTGHFWEGRFKLQVLLDEASLLACAAYVDLNPVRAALAETPEASQFTGASDRLADLSEEVSPQEAPPQETPSQELLPQEAPPEAASRQDPCQKPSPRPHRTSTHDRERSRGCLRSGWLSPIEIDERNDPIGADIDSSGRRASSKGFLSTSLTDYLQLLDWTGRQLRAAKVGHIPEHLSPILARIGLDPPGWCDLVLRFGKTFKRAAGTADHLAQEAARRGQHWLQAPGNPLASAA